VPVNIPKRWFPRDVSWISQGVLNVLGAGDAFASWFFLYGILQRLGILKKGVRNGQMLVALQVVTKKGWCQLYAHLEEIHGLYKAERRILIL